LPIAESGRPNQPATVVANLISNIKTVLTEDFATGPPYTLQRLAELILKPRQHYKYLPAYLQAVYRVASVSSAQSAYPPTDRQNGVENLLGNDESLGGALLTPIPWLLNHTPSPSGPLTPSTEVSSNAPKMSDDGTTVGSPENAALSEEEEEVPHARGPDEIGVEDTGLQTGKGGVEGILENAEKALTGATEGESEGEAMDVDKPEEVEEEKKIDEA
jgi:hypothetical protein